MSSRASKVFRIVIACALSASAACYSAPKLSEAGTSPFVRLSGRGATGTDVRIIWGPASGDITTTYVKGVRERVWFKDQRLVREGIFGDVYEMPRADADMARARRVVFTSEFRNSNPLRVAQSSGIRLAVYQGPGALRIALRSAIGGAVSTATIGADVIAGLRYDGNYAVAWNSFNGSRFERTSGPEPAPSFPDVPRSIWERGTLPDGALHAKSAGENARLLVDTSVRGLVVSRAFAEKVHATVLSAGSSGGVFGHGMSPLVELPDVIIGGKRVAPAVAVVTQNSRYDLVAGIGLFPKTGLLFDHTGVVKTTRRTCSHGIPVSTSEGVVLLNGPDTTTSKLTTLLATGHSGPPSVDLSYALSPSFGASHTSSRKDDASEITRCTSGRRALSFGGRPFGADVICYTRSAFSAVTSDSNTPNFVVGLDSLAARELLVDLRSNTICWSS